jgi:hypothetical protein
MMKRNMRPFYAAQYQGREEILDEDGYATGEYAPSYSEPVLMHGNLSPDKGSNAYADVFGISTPYQQVLYMQDPNCPIKEDSILWTEVESGEKYPDPTKPYDRIVKGVARGLESVKYAIAKVANQGGEKVA